MIGWKPPDDFAEKSRLRLTSIFQRQSEKKESLRKARHSEQTAVFTLLRNLVNENKDIEKIVKDSRERSKNHAKALLPAPHRRKVEPRTRFGSVGVTFAPNYNWQWTWNAESGSSPQDLVNASVNGNMSFEAWTGDNGKTASCAVAVGGYFRPTPDNGVMDISSTPSFSYVWDSDNVLDSSHSFAFIGLYVGEYTLQGDFVQAVVDQKISLWNSTGGSDQGSNSGFPLFASCPIDSDHFYEIWVWAGGDAEADGWSLFWGSAALSSMQIYVPSISIYAY